MKTDMSKQTAQQPPETWSRTMILRVDPQVDEGRHPVKRIVNEDVLVSADIVSDGHDIPAAEVLYGPEGEDEVAVRMTFLGNDLYQALFTPDRMGVWTYRVRAWIDQFATWQELFERRVKGGSPEAELKSELQEGASILKKSLGRAEAEDRKRLQDYIDAFEAGEVNRALEGEVQALAALYDTREGATESDVRRALVERPLARTSAWYEFFPRSVGPDHEHGTLDDAADMLPYVKEMGFDIVYLPPIHPIGRSHRKGKDNAPVAAEGEPGSPWAIGNEDGGHKTVHPELGGIEAFDRFMERARELDLEVALDLAYQCAPDHPYTKEHPEWFRQRPDGSIRYAENPPKKYQDIYPINFEGDNWEALWLELRDVVEFWAKRGVRTFRVDNPHTKPLPFWAWCFSTLRESYPDLIFLAEAFTRPKLMYALGKVGFSQSYTYFTWRYNKQEFQDYLTELFHTDVYNYYRPSFWPNTPDILPPYLDNKPTFQSRLILASTLSASYGIYGPAFELMASDIHPAREEYRDNEKYEIKDWDLDAPHSLKPLITRINTIRRENSALHHNRNLQFHDVDNDELIAYSKRDGDNLILVVVNFDPHYTQSSFVQLPLAELGLEPHQPYELEDLIDGARYYWHGPRNYLELDPHKFPAHVFKVHREVGREQDHDTFV
ncbi:MAG: alpha-1,4-glucan--maltose-1-phosphate maltosyltransferase [Trueperaceae bacterium]|nr:alpha-1,4-glucan--maltose-1-phosphate maltosyltransferase [Trueperaceae bacterium]